MSVLINALIITILFIEQQSMLVYLTHMFIMLKPSSFNYVDYCLCSNNMEKENRQYTHTQRVENETHNGNRLRCVDLYFSIFSCEF